MSDIKLIHHPDTCEVIRYSCRNCSLDLAKPVVTLNKMPLTDEFILEKNKDAYEYLEDINIFQCVACGLVQNPADFDHEKYYKNYEYSSGYSVFVRDFMKLYSESLVASFIDINKRPPSSILEIGSGDGVQLKCFENLGQVELLGVEPSEFLARIAIESNIPTHIGLFDKTSPQILGRKVDICLSSFTLDHVRSPVEYLQGAHKLLNENGILAFEIHDLDKIISRSEYCLFEHEHTIYMDRVTAIRLVRVHGFEVIAVNPLPENKVRGNSLIIIAKKIPVTVNISNEIIAPENLSLSTLGNQIKTTIKRIDDWILAIEPGSDLVGFGAGGRGVMTLAALEQCNRFSALFDSNFKGGAYLTPKTRIQVVDPNQWKMYSKAYCLVFSFGYYSEIKAQLLSQGFDENKIFSLANFFPQ